MKLAIFLSLLKKEDFIKLLKKGVLKPYLLRPNVTNVLSFVTDHGTTGLPFCKKTLEMAAVKSHI